MACVSRRSILVLVVGSAVLVGFALAAYAERKGGTSASVTRDTAAVPQSKVLDWSEKQGRKGERIVFGVERFQVLRDGWRARISLRNESKVALELKRSQRSFGLMLFTSNKHSQLEALMRKQALPTLRPAISYEPPLPSTLDPQASWTGTISAPGALVAGSFVRFVFGYFELIGRAPDTFPSDFTWITDHAYRLQGSSPE